MNLLLLALEALARIADLVQKLRGMARQSGELTPEQDAALDAQFEKMFTEPHWQPSIPPTKENE